MHRAVKITSVLLSDCLSVCPHSYGRNFYPILMKFSRELGIRTLSFRFKIRCSFPLFLNFSSSYIMHFQREVPNTTVTKLAIGLNNASQRPLYMSKVAKCKIQFCPHPKKTENGDQCIFSGNNISATVRDKVMVSKDHHWETIYCEANGHVADDVT